MTGTLFSNIYPKIEGLAKITSHNKLDVLLICDDKSIENKVESMCQHYKNLIYQIALPPIFT